MVKYHLSIVRLGQTRASAAHRNDSTNKDVDYESIYPDCQVVSVDPKYYLEKYNINIKPTIIAVDEFGFVQGIHYGFSKFVNKKILIDFTSFELD